MAKLKSTDIYGSLQVQGHTTLESLVIKEEFKDLLEDSRLVSEISGIPVLISDGLILQGDLEGASLHVKNISGISETGEGKDNLYINFDGGSEYESNRQLIIQSDIAGAHYGHNLYQYAAARGDAVKNWVEAKKYFDGSSTIAVEYINPNFALELKHTSAGSVGIHNKNGELHISNKGGSIENSQAVVLDNDTRLSDAREAIDVHEWAKKPFLDVNDVPILNQDTTGSAFKLENKKNIKVGGRTLQFDGTEDLSYELDDIFNVNTNGFIKRTGNNTFSIDGTSYLPLTSATLQQITTRGNTTTTQVNIGSSEAPVEALSVAGNIRLRNAGGTIATTTGDINIATRAGNGDINLKPHGTGSVNVEGDLNVAGSINTINTQVIAVKDKVIELGHIDPTSSEHAGKLDPDDDTANMGGIVLKGATDKTILWNKTTQSWELNNGLRIVGGSKQPGSFYPGTISATNSVRLNYDGHLYAKELYSDGQLVGTQSWIMNTATVNDSNKFGGNVPEFYVNKNRTINGHELDKDIELTYADVGASQNTHGHGNITNLGAIGTTAGLMIKTSANGVLSTLAAGTAGQFLGHDGTWKTPVDTKYTAGDNITIDNNNKIIAVDTKYTTATSSVSGLIKTGYVVSGKTYPVEIDQAGRAYVSVPWENTTYSFYNIAFQNTNGSTVDTYKPSTSPSKVLKAGTNVDMTASSNTITITATDTKYSAGTNVQISAGNAISATDTKYSEGDNVKISAGNVISATDTTYGIASTSTAGLVKLGSAKLTSLDTPAAKTTAGRYYPIGLDKSDKAVVNVPWIEYSAGDGIKLDGASFKHTNVLAQYGTIGSNSVGGATIVKPGFGGKFKVPTFTFDKHGHVTGGGDIEIELPEVPAPPHIEIGVNSNAEATSNATGQAIVGLSVDSSNRHKIIPKVDTFLKAESSTLNDVLLRGRLAAYTNSPDRLIPGTNGDSIAMDIQVHADNDAENKGSFIRFGTSLLNYKSDGSPETATSYGGLIGSHRLPGGASSLLFGNSNTIGVVSHQMRISIADDGKARVGIGTTGYAREMLEVSGDVLLSASNSAIRSDTGNLNIETTAGDGNIILKPDGTGSVNVEGDLNVSGTINTVNVDVIKVKDKIIELGHLEAGNPTDATSNGGGIKLIGTSGSTKSILWDTSGTWTSNQAFKITGGSKSAGSLYIGDDAPTSKNRLNYDGYLYATKLYSGGSEVLTAYIDTKYVAGTGLTLDETTFNHTNSVSGGASKKGPVENASPGYGGKFNVPEIEYDANGHIKSATNREITMPSAQLIPDLSISGVSAGDNKYISDLTVSGHAITASMGTMHKVATSGDYNDLTNKLTIPSMMSTTEGNTGTATTQRTINAANLKSIILNHSPAGSRPASDVSAWAKKSSLAIGDIPTGTTGTTVALGNHTHSQYVTKNDTITIDVPVNTDKDIITGTIATNDFYRIRAGGVSNAGYLEIATADDGNEPIYVRQYNGTFTSLTRTLALLDGSGNTTIPGSAAIAGSVTVGSAAVNGTNSGTMQYNTTTQSIEFIFN